MSTPRLLVLLLCACILSFALVPLPRQIGSLVRGAAAPSLVTPRYASEMTTAEPFLDFFSALESAISRDNFLSVSLAKPTLPSKPSPLAPQLLQSVTGRLVMLKAGLHLQLSLRYPTNEQCKNWPVGATAATAAASLELQRLATANAFRKAQLTTATRRIDMTMNHATGQVRAAEEEAAAPAPVPSPQSLRHDRAKTRPVDPASPFLHALGVTTASGRPLTGMRDKLRQIERFVEILAGLVDKSPSLSLPLSKHRHNPEGAKAKANAVVDADAADLEAPAPLRIVDMGSGLAYLTFAVHNYFQGRYRNVETVGVESRLALVQRCQEVARRLGGEYDSLRFVAGDIEEFASAGARGAGAGGREVGRETGGDEAREAEAVARAVASSRTALPATPTLTSPTSPADDLGQMDVLVALHACDTATDLAIFSGIARGASVIVTSPCCHKEARRQIDAGLPKHPKHSSPSSTTSTSSSGSSGTSSSSSGGGGGGGVQTLLGVGIFRERTAEMVTDAIRAQCLEWAGYDCTVLEFVGGEHTAKNVMLAAVRREGTGEGRTAAEEAAGKIAGLMCTYGLRQQHLVGLLGIDVGMQAGMEVGVGTAKGKGRGRLPKL